MAVHLKFEVLHLNEIWNSVFEHMKQVTIFDNDAQPHL